MENIFEKSDFYAMPERERIEALHANCEEVKNNFLYSKPLTKGEKEQRNSEINQSISEIERLKEERKAINSKITEHQSIIKQNNEEVVQGFVEVREMVWSVANLHSGYIEKVNSEGYIIEKHRFRNGTQVSLFNKTNNLEEEKRQDVV